jgi:glycosyltransferase involved in cell wall biosynthesis
MAVLIPAIAEDRDGGIAVTSRFGPQLELVAERIGMTTVLGYDMPARPRAEDRADYVMRPNGGRMQFVSLGPKGNWRDFWSRRKRVRAIVERESPKWDLLSLPVVNRRVALVYYPSKCRRIWSQAGGHTVDAIRHSKRPFYKKALPLLHALWVQRTVDRLAREGLFLVNGEGMLKHYQKPGMNVDVVRTSARRAEFTFHADDRLTGADPQLVVVSRLNEVKAIDDVLRMFKILRDKAMPTARLHIVGNGEEEASLRALASELGVADAVEWHGWVPHGPELFALVQQMDVLVTLSHYEGLPKTAWECMAHSVLVVSTPVGAMRDVFRDEEHVLFVPESDPAAAAAAIERLANDPQLRRRLLEQGRLSAEAVTAEAVAAELVDRITQRWPELLGVDAAR